MSFGYDLSTAIRYLAVNDMELVANFLGRDSPGILGSDKFASILGELCTNAWPSDGRLCQGIDGGDGLLRSWLCESFPGNIGRK